MIIKDTTKAGGPKLDLTDGMQGGLRLIQSGKNMKKIVKERKRKRYFEC